VAYYSNGNPSEIILHKENLIVTAYGVFVPQFRPWNDGRGYESTIHLYSDGSLKSFLLQERTPVKTLLGIIMCDAVSFHEDGSLYRIFPFNGNFTGGWDETKEYALSEAINVCGGEYNFSAKMISVEFYPSGKLRGIVLWPEEKVMLETQQGIYPVRAGMSFYENGMIRSLEPAVPIKVPTPIGEITAYSPDYHWEQGAVYSLEFEIDGNVKKIATVVNRVSVYDGDTRSEFQPVYNAAGGGRNPDPLRIAFDNAYVFIGGTELYVFRRKDFRFELSAFQHADDTCREEYTGIRA